MILNILRVPPPDAARNGRQESRSTSPAHEKMNLSRALAGLMVS